MWFFLFKYFCIRKLFINNTLFFVYCAILIHVLLSFHSHDAYDHRLFMENGGTKERHHTKVIGWLDEMTKITNSNQSQNTYRKYKSENGRTRTSEHIRGGIRCHGGVSIPCWEFTLQMNTGVQIIHWNIAYRKCK
jgi:hypothetical protein